MNDIRLFDKFVNIKNRNTNKRNLNLNLENNNKYNKTTIIHNNRNNNNLNKNTFFLNNTYVNQKRNFQNYMKNKTRTKIIPGMFSYKKTTSSNLSNSYDSRNISRNNSIQNSNKLNINKQNHLLFPNLKLLIDNTEISSFTTLTNNDNNMSNNFPSLSSLNLDKYKITNDNNNKNNSIDKGKTFNNINYNYDFLKYNNIIINNIHQPKYKSRTNEIKNMNLKKIIKRNNSTQYNNSKKETNESLNISNEKEIKIKNYFKGKTKSENESRRMIVEYLKILKKNKNCKINNILTNNNISYKVLNQQFSLNKNYNLSNLLISNCNKSIETPKKKTNLKNINKFLNDMDDITNDKINMIKFLSLPRIMELIFMEKKYKYIFMLLPNKFSYLKGIESYIFQWNDIKTNKKIGGFDLIKVKTCCINYKNDKNFIIETFDGTNNRQYELFTTSNNISSYYVKSINYLSRLEKCKIFNKKYICN